MTTTRRTLSERLQREWQAMASRPSVLQRAARWELGVPFTSLDDIVAATEWESGGAVEPERPDGQGSTCPHRVLSALVVAAETDELAARVVLQRLLPSLGARARRWRDRFDGRWDAAFDELVATAWLVIRRYPIHRRPTHLIANLVRDTEHQAFVKPTRRTWQAVHVQPRDLDRPVEESEQEEHEGLLVLADALQVARLAISDADLQLMRLLANGHTTAQVAAALEVSVRTVANHRDAAVHRVRAALAA